MNLTATYLTSDTGYTNAYYSFSSFDTNILFPRYRSPPLNRRILVVPTQNQTGPTAVCRLSDTISLLDERILFTAGARYQRVKDTVTDTGIGVASANYDKNAITPALASVVKPLPDLSIYGNYIESLIQQHDDNHQTT